MNAEQRKAELARIQEQSEPCMTGIKLTYHGEQKTFNAYRIPLSILTYNPYNGRIGSVVKSFERQHRELNPDDSTDKAIIEKFLWESRKEANKRTLQSLLTDRQQRYGIVTADGKIIDGNRRASLLNRIWHDDSIPQNNKRHTEFFEAIILPIDADKKEILRLETTYQMGEDAKVDYNPIEKYLKAGDLAAAGFTNVQIASFMGVKQTEVKMYLDVLKLMDVYLETYGYTGIYTVLDTREDSFQKLDSALRQYASGGVAKMWDYDVERDVSDLRQIAFDYIRLGIDQQNFRDIILKPNNNNLDRSFFSNKEIWSSFSQEHFDVTENVIEKSVDDIIHDNPSADISRLLISRDNDWRQKVGEKLNENFQRSRDKLSNKQQAAEPIKLVQKAWEALSAVDITQPSFKEDSGVQVYLDEIAKIIKNFEAILQQ